MRYICKIGTEIGSVKGDLTEWSIVVVWKTIEVQASVGSNPTVSADKSCKPMIYRTFSF